MSGGDRPAPALGGLDPLARVEVDEDDALLAALVPDGPAPAALWRRLAAAVRVAGRLEAQVEAAAAVLGEGAVRARQVLRLVDDPEAWLELLPGVQTLHLRPAPQHARADVGLVRLAPGGAFPFHVHHGGEEVLVLEGALIGEDGAAHGVGAVIRSGPGTGHAVQAGPNGLTYLAVVHGLELPGWELPELPVELLR